LPRFQFATGRKYPQTRLYSSVFCPHAPISYLVPLSATLDADVASTGFATLLNASKRLTVSSGDSFGDPI
jgi:hypothetical protein